MRELRFRVTGQKIKKDTSCDFSGIIAGTKGYLQAGFLFGADWQGMTKVAVFKRLNDEYPVKIINNKCIIPEQALTWRNFKVQCVGKKGDVRLTTNSVIVEQEV